MIMTPEKILCILKKTGYEWYNNTVDGINKFKGLKPYLQEGLRTSHRNQKSFEEYLRVVAGENEINIDYVSETSLDSITSAEIYALIMTCGGDGTFLKVAQHFKDNILLGLNSDTEADPKKGSVGALTSINKNNLEEMMKKVKEGNFNIEEWRRLYAKINGKMLSERAVNDIYFGAEESDGSSSFRLTYDGKSETFPSSSGLIVCTGMGSGAWYRNAGGTPFSNALPAFGFIVREPQLKRAPDFHHGVIGEQYELLVEPHRDEYIVSFDSRKNSRTRLRVVDELLIGLDKENPVKVVCFHKP